MKKENTFSVPLDFYSKDVVFDKQKIIYNFDLGAKTEIKIHNPRISHLLNYLLDFDLGNNIVSIQSIYTDKKITPKEKRKIFDSIPRILANGYDKGLNLFNKELKPTLDNLYLSDLNRFVKEFDFYYNEREYSVVKDEPRLSIPVSKFLKMKPVIFNEINIHNWGYLSALQFELFSYSLSKPDIIQYTKPEFSIREKSIINKINFIFIKIKQIEKTNSKPPYTSLKNDFENVLKMYQTFENTSIEKSRIEILKNKILKAIETFETKIPVLKEQDYFIDFKKSFIDANSVKQLHKQTNTILEVKAKEQQREHFSNYYNKIDTSSFFSLNNFVMMYHKEAKKEILTNKPIRLSVSNWNKNKDTFIEQRFKEYEKQDLTIKQIKDLEKDNIESLPYDKNFEVLKDWYNEALNELNKKPNENKKEVKFKGFFTGLEQKQIDEIRTKFKDLKGKKLAIFISLCVHEFKILQFASNDKSGYSCLSFTKYFENNNNYQSVNRYLLSNFKFTGIEADKTTIKKQLESILKNIES